MSVPDGGSTVATPPFEFGVRVGIVFIVESASLSALAVTSLLLYIAVSTFEFRRRVFLDFYFLSLHFVLQLLIASL